MELPKNVELDAEEAEKFALLVKLQKELPARQSAMQQMAKMQIAEMMRVSEARAAELTAAMQKAQEDATKLWKDVGAKHGLDLEKIEYALSDDGKTLKPVGMRLG